jgi:hypothetical protein
MTSLASRTALAAAIALLVAGCSDDEGTGATGTGGGGAGGSSSGTTMPTDCDYPEPSMGVGVEEGQTLPAALSWTGFAPEATMASAISIADMHDCDGTHGIHALLLSTLQPETMASGNHVAALRVQLGDWSERGILVAFLLLNNPDGSEVTTEGAAGWRQSYMVEEQPYVLVDPDFLLVSGGQVNTPQNTLVDPRTMQVTAITEGHPFDTAPLEELADSNAP